MTVKIMMKILMIAKMKMNEATKTGRLDPRKLIRNVV